MSNKFDQNSKTIRLLLLTLLGLTITLVLAFWLAPTQTTAAPQITGTPHFLPLVRKDPTPTPIPMPQVVETVPIPAAKCSNTIGFNPFSGYIYVGNSVSNDVSILKNRQFVTTIETPLKNPTTIAHVEGSDRTYVTFVTDQGVGAQQIMVLEKDQVIGYIPDFFEPYAAAYNPVNGYLYVTDLNSVLSIYDGVTLIKHLPLETAGGQLSGWPLSIAVDSSTGLVYVPSWERGIVYVIDGTTVVDDFQGGWGTRSIAIDPVSGYIYMAHSDPNGAYPYNISVFHRDNPIMTHISTAPNAHMVAVDSTSGLAYFANQEGDSITVMRGRELLGTVTAGHEPWAVAVNPNSGYAYIVSRGYLQDQGGTGEVTVLNGTQVVARLNGGYRPWAITFNPVDNEIYVLNRGSYVYIDEVKRQFEYCQQAAITVIR